MEKTEYYGYARVSTDEQKKLGYSIGQQVSAIEDKIAEMENVSLNEMFIDDGYTSRNLKRPNFQRFLKTVAQNRTKKVLFVRHPDRIVRNLTYKRSLECVFAKYNVEVVCLNGSWKEKEPEKNVVADITMLFGENEVNNIPFRVICGYIGSAEVGNYPIGTVPRGYKRVKNTRYGRGTIIVPDEIEAPIVAKIFNTLLTNRVNATDMAKYLNKKHTLGKRWNHKYLIRMIDNPIYYGRLKTDWFDSENPSIRPEKKIYWYSEKYHTQPIISKEEWEAVQKVVHHKKARTLHHYAFNRLVKCSCGKYTNCEPAWKTKRNGDRELYKYYYCEECKKRISEKVIMKEFLRAYPIYKVNSKDKQLIESLEAKIKNIKNRINNLNYDYDRGLMDEDLFKESLEIAYMSIKKCQSEITTIKGSTTSDFNAMTELQQRSIIISAVDNILVDMEKKSVKIIFKNPKTSK